MAEKRALRRAIEHIYISVADEARRHGRRHDVAGISNISARGEISAHVAAWHASRKTALICVAMARRAARMANINENQAENDGMKVTSVSSIKIVPWRDIARGNASIVRGAR